MVKIPRVYIYQNLFDMHIYRIERRSDGDRQKDNLCRANSKGSEQPAQFDQRLYC